MTPTEYINWIMPWMGAVIITIGFILFVAMILFAIYMLIWSFFE